MIIAQCAHQFTTSYGLPTSLFLAGLVGGLSHCAWMCGPFVLAQVGAYKHGEGEKSAESQAVFHRLKSTALLPYHLGRMTTYVVLAILVSSVINLAFVFSDSKSFISAPLLVLAAVIFLVTAFPKMARIFPWVSFFQRAVPFRWISKNVAVLMERSSVFSRYLLGVLLGFMPCGLVVSALMASATAPDVFQSALAMTAFSAGTVPSLLCVALGGRALMHKYPKMGLYISRGGMIVSSVWLFVLAGIMVF
ncbi:MAG: sulfite exporter TauE/SafE family protein [Alphaproteobacteria bacterium]